MTHAQKGQVTTATQNGTSVIATIWNKHRLLRYAILLFAAWLAAKIILVAFAILPDGGDGFLTYGLVIGVILLVINNHLLDRKQQRQITLEQERNDAQALELFGIKDRLATAEETVARFVAKENREALKSISGATNKLESLLEMLNGIDGFDLPNFMAQRKRDGLIQRMKDLLDGKTPISQFEPLVSEVNAFVETAKADIEARRAQLAEQAKTAPQPPEPARVFGRAPVNMVGRPDQQPQGPAPERTAGKLFFSQPAEEVAPAAEPVSTAWHFDPAPTTPVPAVEIELDVPAFLRRLAHPERPADGSN